MPYAAALPEPFYRRSTIRRSEKQLRQITLDHPEWRPPNINQLIQPQTIATLIQEAGYHSAIIDDEDLFGVRFRVEGVDYSFELFRDDYTYARIFTGARLPDNAAVQNTLQAANRTNSLLKAVKTVVYKDDGFVGFSVEQLFTEQPQLEAQLDRSLDALHIAKVEFFRNLSTNFNEHDTEENA